MNRDNAAGIHTLFLTGVSGLATMSDRGSFVSPHPDSFVSDWRAVAIDGVTVGEWQISPVSGSCIVGNDTPGVVIAVITEGLFRCQVRTEVLDGTPDCVLILASTETIRFTVPTSMRMLRIEVPTAVLPQVARPLSVATLGTTSPTRLTASLLSVVEMVLDPRLGGVDCPAAQAVQALATAVLEEVAPNSVEASMRTQIVAYIDTNLSDPGLGPQSIASTFGVSLRWMHHLFSRDEESISRYIRHRRLDLVAAELRTHHRTPKAAAIAHRHGFTSRDHLTRAFKSRYGTTITSYATLADNGHAPEPRPDTDPTSESDTAPA